MQSKFFIGDSTVDIYKISEEALVNKLPPQVYTLRFAQMRGFYLQITKDNLDVPAKIYGDTTNRVDKCIKSYQDRNSSTGILLTGDKGTGKSLLMALLANRVVNDLELPVILIKDAFAGTEFTSFLEDVGECAVVFDEFGKMYAASDRHNQEGEVPQKALLSLMDGVDKTKRMFILTENSELDINDFMLNRPSRVYYHFKYKKLDETSVLGFCADKNVNEETIKDIIDLARRSKVFSFDMLQSIVEEHLRFNSTVEDATADLNIDTREDNGAMIEILKVIERGTEDERELFETPFVSKPDRYTYIKIKSNVEARRKPKVTSSGAQGQANDFAELDVTADSDDQQAYEEIYVQASDLAYEKEGKLFYQTEKYVFIAKNIESPRTNWSLLL